MAFNKAILIGNMCADPELKQSASGISVCSFSIAVNRRKSKEGNPETDFINIVAWRSTAEFIAKYFRKGQPILVCGQIQTRSWTDNANNKRYATEVVADEVSFVGSKEGAQSVKNEPQTPAYAPTVPTPNFEEISSDEDLPF